MIMKPILRQGNLGMPAEHSDHACYVVGYAQAVLEVDKANTLVAIRGVKYSTHLESAEERPDAPPDDETRITILLVGGPWRQCMWLKPDKSDLVEFTLERPGDYLVWEPGYYHKWQPLGDATMLTVSLFQPRLTLTIREEGEAESGGGVPRPVEESVV